MQFLLFVFRLKSPQVEDSTLKVLDIIQSGPNFLLGEYQQTHSTLLNLHFYSFKEFDS